MVNLSKGLKEVAIKNFQVENKMADRQNIFTPKHWLIPIIGLQTGSQLNGVFEDQILHE